MPGSRADSVEAANADSVHIGTAAFERSESIHAGTLATNETDADENLYSVSVRGRERYDYAWDVLSLVNKERKKEGLPSLVMGSGLLGAAMLRADEAHLRFSHERPDGTSCFTAFPSISSGSDGYYGENIALGQKTPKEVVKGWMNSPGHRSNIMNENFTAIGIGVTGYAYENGTLYAWTQCFASTEGGKADKPKNKTKTRRIEVSKDTYPLTFRVVNAKYNKISNVHLRVGKTKQLYLAFKGEETFFGYMKSPKSAPVFRVSPSKLAKIKNGKVRARKSGSGRIIISDGDKNLKKIKLTVRKK
jgi:uncharacterized protein YkwD